MWRFPFWQALSAGRLEDIVALRRAIEALGRGFAADLVHMNGVGPSTLFHRWSGWVRRTPLLLALHSSNTLSSVATTLVRQTLESADWVAACSRSLLDAARTAAPAIAARASVVYNGVDVPELAPAAFPTELRVLCLGQLAPHKGFDLMVRALPSLLQRFPNLRLILAGEGPSRSDLEQLAVRQRLGGAIEFTGAVSHLDVPRLVNAATVVAVPSRRESFGLVAVEAALMARPVVAARVGGLPEVVAHGETGLLVEPESSTDLASAIGALLASPPAARRLGAEARRRALHRFGVGRQADAYENLYRRVVAEDGARNLLSSAPTGRGVDAACE